MTYTLEEATVERYLDLNTAQRAGLQAIAGALARAVRAGIESGSLTVRDGVVFLADSPTIRPEPQDTEALSVQFGQIASEVS